MKILCDSCGVHWQEEFQATIGTSCSFWVKQRFSPAGFVDSEKGQELLKKLWDHYFSLDHDAITDEYKVVLTASINGFYGPAELDADGKFVNWYVKNIPGYSSWDDAKQRRFQSAYYRYWTRDQFMKVQNQAIIDFSKTWVDAEEK